MTKTILVFIGGFAVGFILIWGWNAYQDRSLAIEGESTTPDDVALVDSETMSSETTDSVISDETETAIENTTSIVVEDQLAGGSIEVASVVLPVDGWVVVHEEINGVIGNALGAARRDAGTQNDIAIPLLRDTIQGNRYWVVLYSDDGDRSFSLTTDFPIRDSAESAITRSFQAL